MGQMGQGGSKVVQVWFSVRLSDEDLILKRFGKIWLEVGRGDERGKTKGDVR